MTCILPFRGARLSPFNRSAHSRQGCVTSRSPICAILKPDTMTQNVNTGSAPFAFDNTFARDLEGLYVPWKAVQVTRPSLVKFNRELAEELGLDANGLDSEEGAKIFAGNQAPEGAAPLAQAYAGHQFGGFVPQLGDGRALLLGEVIDRYGRR